LCPCPISYGMSFLKKHILSFLYRIGLMANPVRKELDAYVKKHASKNKTLDIGSGGNTYADFFPNRVSVDIAALPGVDVVADVHELSKHFQKEDFDTVLCIEALEHFYHPHVAVEEMKKVLKPGGTLILTTRFIFPLHEVPHDYFRFTEYGLKHLLRDFEIVEFQKQGNTMETLAILYQRIGYQCDTLWFKPFKLLWFIEAIFIRIFSFILTKEYGDITHKSPIDSIMTSGYFVVARKK